MLHIGRNIISLLFSRILSGIILFLIYTRLAQYLGPQQAGQYGLLMAYVTVFNFFIDLGMSQLVVKKVSEDRAQSEKYLSNYFSVQAILAFVFMIIMDAVVLFQNYPEIVKWSLYMASFGLFLSTLSLPFRSIVNASQKLTIIAKVNFFNSLINACIMVLAIVLRKDILFLSFISVAVGLFDLIVYGIIVDLKISKFRLAFDKVFIKQLFIATLPFTALTFFSIYNRVDTLLLPSLRNFTETGYYAAAYKFWDTLAFVPAVIGISLYPFFAQKFAQNRLEDVKAGLSIYTRYMVALAAPLAVGAFMLAPKLTMAFYGKDFLPAADALWLLVLAVSLLIIYVPVNSVIISQKTKIATKITGFNLLYNIGLNLILIPKFGFVAAAAVTVGSELIQTIAYTYVVKKQIVNFVFFRSFIKPVAAVCVMAFGLYIFRAQSVWALLIIGGVFYIVALLVLRFFNRSDWELFKAAIDIRKSVDKEILS